MDVYEAPEAATPKRTRGWLLIGVAAVLTPVLHAVCALFITGMAVSEIKASASLYDQLYDPVVVENGVVRAGPRLPDWSDGNRRFFVDPDETIPATSIDEVEYVAIRRTEIVRHEVFRHQAYNVADLQKGIGVDPLVVDSANISDMIGRYSTLLVAGATLMYAALGILDIAFNAVLAAIAAFPLSRFWSESSGHYLFGICMLWTLPIVLVRFAIWEWGNLGCIGLVAWPPLIAIGATITLKLQGR